MAVEARHIDLFPSQLISHRDFAKSNQVTSNMCNTQMDFYLPFAETMPCVEPLLPADSGLTYHLNHAAAPRKRPRDNNNNNNSIYDLDGSFPQKSKLSSFSSFLDEDFILQFQQQQQEIDRHIAHHVEKVRLELEERRKRQSRILLSAIQQGIVKKLKEKDEEIQRMGKLNWVLQERVKSLYVENQIWRDLAQTNEATANSLRTNLEQVLAHVSDDNRHVSPAGNAEDDAESSCGSSDSGRRCKVVGTNSRLCRRCGEKESSVLVLPCRHLCLCTVCGSSLLGSCPVCDSVMDASLHINMS